MLSPFATKEILREINRLEQDNEENSAKIKLLRSIIREPKPMVFNGEKLVKTPRKSPRRIHFRGETSRKEIAEHIEGIINHYPGITFNRLHSELIHRNPVYKKLSLKSIYARVSKLVKDGNLTKKYKPGSPNLLYIK